MSSKSIRVRPVRGTTKANDMYTGPYGSISVDVEKKQLRIHDGVTPGGTVVGGTTTPSQAQESLIQAFDKLGNFPAMGKQGVLYVAIDTATGYRWSDGGSYIAIAPKPENTNELKEGEHNLYFTTERARAAFTTNDGILLDQDGTLKARIASDESLRKGEEKGEFVTPKVLLDWLKASGFTQDANGNLLPPGTKAPEPEKEVPSTPETKPSEGDKVDENGISTFDTTNNKGVLARYAARINENFLTKKTLGGKESWRMKYSNDKDMYTYHKAIIDEDAPYAIINMDNMEYAVGTYDWPGLDPHQHQMKLITINNQSNVISMIKRSNLDDGQFVFPVSFGYVDQPESMPSQEIDKKYKLSLSVVGKAGGPGVQYNSGVGLGGGGLLMRMSIDGKTVGSDFSSKYVSGKGGFPLQRNLTMNLSKEEAEKAFPNNEIYSEATGSNYVQVAGDFIVTMKMTNTETNETKELSFPLTAIRYDS